MKALIFSNLIFVVLTMPSCVGGGIGNLLTHAQSQNYTYNLSENGCSTGEHTFSSNESMCDGLRDDSLNNYCATNLRYLKFQSDCPGRTW